MIMSCEKQNELSIPEGNWNTGDMTNDVDELIESSLSKAGSVS